jgi:hypothetical protein
MSDPDRLTSRDDTASVLEYGHPCRKSVTIKDVNSIGAFERRNQLLLRRMISHAEDLKRARPFRSPDRPQDREV